MRTTLRNWLLFFPLGVLVRVYLRQEKPSPTAHRPPVGPALIPPELRTSALWGARVGEWPLGHPSGVWKYEVIPMPARPKRDTRSAEPRARAAWSTGAHTVTQLVSVGQMSRATASKWRRVFRAEKANRAATLAAVTTANRPRAVR
jgi:hypothetical protein